MDEKVVVDMKQYLFEAELNEQLGNSNIDTCQHLIKLAPSYLPAYELIRKEAISNNIAIEMDENDEDNDLVNAFNDAKVSDDDFKKKLDDSDQNNFEFKQFSRKIRKIKITAC